MLPRTFINPTEHWVTKPSLPYSQAVRCGQMLFLTGQVDLDQNLHVTAPDDLIGQTKNTMRQLRDVLAAARMNFSDLVQMRVFYVQDGNVNEDDLIYVLGTCLGPFDGFGPALTMVPVEGLMLPGILIEIDGIAMREENAQPLAKTAAWHPGVHFPPKPFSHAVRVGEMIFTSGITSRVSDGTIHCPGSLLEQSKHVLDRIEELLDQLGADLQDTVKTNVFNVERGTAEEWSTPALVRASYYREPGPAATGISLPRLWPDGLMATNDVIAMRNVDGSRINRTHAWPDNHWDWPVHLPYRHGIRCGNHVFLGGQVPLNPDASVACRGDMVAQTEMAMEYIRRILASFGLGFEHVVKINTFYSGETGERDWKPNLRARFGHFTLPGPATTGVPVPYLAYEGMNIEIDIVALV